MEINLDKVEKARRLQQKIQQKETKQKVLVKEERLKRSPDNNK